MRHLLPFEPPPADYPNHLTTTQPEQLQLPSARWLLLLLVVLCLLPRAVIALRVPSICIDGAIYVNTARALEAGDFRAALMEGAINVYSVILMVLHRCGLGWEAAAALWGVTISSLVVLPLWGWVRRQYDDRVALVACLLYIVHPTFIVESPEVMRDPTSWFLFTLAIYCLWRAVTEVRYDWFMAFGAAITLAVLTRVEGLFLLIPLVLWTFWRWLALQTARRKLLVGATLCVLVFPLLLVLVNAVWLYDHVGGTTIRLSPLARVQPWLESLMGLQPAGGESAAPPIHIGRMICVFFPTMTRGMAPLFALLLFGGMWGWRRVWARRDNQALFFTCVVILCGIWVQLWYDRNISRRYPLPIVLLGSPFAALGLLWLTAWLQRVGRWLGWQARSQRAAAAATMALILVSGLAHAMTRADEARRMAANVGYWLRQEFSAPPTVVGPSFMARIVNYYSEHSRYVTVPPEANDEVILNMVTQNRADVVILWPSKRLSPERCASLIDRMRPAGLAPIGPAVLPDAVGKFHVLVRAPRLECARKPTQER
jgi:hypothetical protein